MITCPAFRSIAPLRCLALIVPLSLVACASDGGAPQQRSQQATAASTTSGNSAQPAARRSAHDAPIHADADAVDRRASALHAVAESKESAPHPGEARSPAHAAPRVLEPFPGIVVRADDHMVELDGFICIEAGWLEQVACKPGSREHEALAVIAPATASQVHAALLMAGFEPGKPAGWCYDAETKTHIFLPPQGSALRITFEWRDAEGAVQRAAPHEWIRDAHGRQTFPEQPWIFAGSFFHKTPPAFIDRYGEEMYAADESGSIIGLATFGDEVIGYSRELSPDEAVQPPEWEAATDRLPPFETPVKVIIAPWRDTAKPAGGDAPAS